MASELTVSVSLSGAKTWALKNLQLAGIQPDMAGTKFMQGSQLVPTTAGGTAINLGTLATVGWFLIINRDTTNFVSLYNAVSGTKFAKLKFGEPCCGRFDPSVTAPAAIADTAACLIEYLIFEI